MSGDVLSESPPPLLTNEEVVTGVSSAKNAVNEDIRNESNSTEQDEEPKNEKGIPQQPKQQQSPPLHNKSDSSSSSNGNIPNYDDEQTYLDLFGERAKELLTQHIIPATDASCRWDWRMGRCEPYCECGYYFLWGDYHLGRSCRLRSKFTPVQQSGGEVKASSSLQDAWEQWADQMDDPDAFASFVDSSKKPPSDVDSCSLPPESRYTQVVFHFTKLLGHGTIVLHQFQRVKQYAVKVGLDVVTQGKHKFSNGRENACTGLKIMIEERERGRSQPVVLTRRGIVWIRRLCGTSNDTVVYDTNDEQQQPDDAAVDCIEGECFETE
jgi:hypothetical protein